LDGLIRAVKFTTLTPEAITAMARRPWWKLWR